MAPLGAVSHRFFLGKPAGKRPLESPRCRWEDNIRMELKERVFSTRNWFDSAQGFLESPCKCGIEPPVFIKHGVS